MLDGVLGVEGLVQVLFDVDFTVVDLELLLHLDNPLNLIDDFIMFLLQLRLILLHFFDFEVHVFDLLSQVLVLSSCRSS